VGRRLDRPAILASDARGHPPSGLDGQLLRAGQPGSGGTVHQNLAQGPGRETRVCAGPGQASPVGTRPEISCILERIWGARDRAGGAPAGRRARQKRVGDCNQVF